MECRAFEAGRQGWEEGLRENIGYVRISGEREGLKKGNCGNEGYDWEGTGKGE